MQSVTMRQRATNVRATAISSDQQVVRWRHGRFLALQMPNTKNRTPTRADSDETPSGRLHEGPLKRLLGYQVAQANLVTLAVFDEVVGRERALRTAEYTVLALLDANGVASPANLAKALRLSPSYITMALDTLEGRGFIRREKNERDRRGQRVMLTTQGSQEAAEMTTMLLEAERSRFTALSEVEQLMLAELLRKLAVHR